MQYCLLLNLSKISHVLKYPELVECIFKYLLHVYCNSHPIDAHFFENYFKLLIYGNDYDWNTEVETPGIITESQLIFWKVIFNWCVQFTLKLSYISMFIFLIYKSSRVPHCSIHSLSGPWRVSVLVLHNSYLRQLYHIIVYFTSYWWFLPPLLMLYQEASQNKDFDWYLWFVIKCFTFKIQLHKER